MNASALQSTFFWTLPLQAILEAADVSISDGLSSTEAAKRRIHYGANTVKRASKQPLWKQFLYRFRNPLVILLLIASLLSALTGNTASFIIITIIILLSISLGLYQEVKAEKNVDTLRQTVAIRVNVLRDGKITSLLAEEIVPGDIIELSAGILIPADGRLIISKDIYVNQSLLTGESFPVEKQAQDINQDTHKNKSRHPPFSQPIKQDTHDIAEASNSVFMGTSIISGTGMMVVVKTGENTQMGELAGLLAASRPSTDFEKGVEKFGVLILRITLVMVLFVLCVNILFHRPMLESFLFSLALAVGLTPELLPMIVTITLSRGAIRMASQGVIVKHLPAMHNLGAMNILCTDKTGTLTESKITLIQSVNTEWQESESVFLWAYLNSYFESGLKSSLDQAILDYHNLDISAWSKIDEVPFDFERRRVSVLARYDHQSFLIVKGAPEDILSLCVYYETVSKEEKLLGENKKEDFIKKFEALGEEGYRVLAVAYRKVDPTHKTAIISDETELIFAGFLVFLDPPKKDVAKIVKKLQQDGVNIKIITGDNERVTKHVCSLIGIDVKEILTGPQMLTLTEEAFQKKIESVHVFCRITPQQKSKIINAYKSNGHTVGFMGDGINDAPAIHAADVGVSVDSGTDPAKEAADIILLKKNLSVIHKGIVEGRRAVINTRKYILMGSSSNFGNMFSMAGASLFLPFLPMLPFQILLNNLLYDISQTAIPFDNVDKKALEKPIHWNIFHIKHFMWVLGPISSIFDFVTFYVLLSYFKADELLFHTGWFVESIVTQVLIIFSIRSSLPIFLSKPNKIVIFMAFLICFVAIMLPFSALNAWLGFVPLSLSFFIFLGIALVIYFVLVEVAKNFFRKDI